MFGTYFFFTVTPGNSFFCVRDWAICLSSFCSWKIIFWNWLTKKRVAKARPRLNRGHALITWLMMVKLVLFVNSQSTCHKIYYKNEKTSIHLHISIKVTFYVHLKKQSHSQYFIFDLHSRQHKFIDKSIWISTWKK